MVIVSLQTEIDDLSSQYMTSRVELSLSFASCTLTMDMGFMCESFGSSLIENSGMYSHTYLDQFHTPINRKLFQGFRTSVL